MNDEVFQALAENHAATIVELLQPFSDEFRQQVMYEVGKHFCKLCWCRLEPGQKCYCAPCYDE